MPGKKVTTITIYFKSIVPVDGKLKAAKVASAAVAAASSAAGTSVSHSGGPPPDVVSSNLSPKVKVSSGKTPTKGNWELGGGF